MVEVLATVADAELAVLEVEEAELLRVHTADGPGGSPRASLAFVWRRCESAGQPAGRAKRSSASRIG